MIGINTFAWAKLEYVRLVFHLEFQDEYTLNLSSLLQLRRELKRVGLYLEDSLPEPVALKLKTLFGGEVPTDPAVRRHLAKTAPPFIIQPPGKMPLQLEAGDVFSLSVLFWGHGCQYAGVFARLLQALGPGGISCGQGEFVLAGVDIETVEGNRVAIWEEGESEWAEPEWAFHAPCNAFTNATEAVLEFIAPARLVSKGKPLFRPSFHELFPYILRRVSGICYAWSGVELLSDATLLLEAIQTGSVDQRLHWEDWRELRSPEATQALGGVVGRLSVSEQWLESAGPVLSVGQLLNLGKNAAYGAGAWRLR